MVFMASTTNNGPTGWTFSTSIEEVEANRARDARYFAAMADARAQRVAQDNANAFRKDLVVAIRAAFAAESK